MSEQLGYDLREADSIECMIGICIYAGVYKDASVYVNDNTVKMEESAD